MSDLGQLLVNCLNYMGIAMADVDIDQLRRPIKVSFSISIGLYEIIKRAGVLRFLFGLKNI